MEVEPMQQQPTENLVSSDPSVVEEQPVVQIEAAQDATNENGGHSKSAETAMEEAKQSNGPDNVEPISVQHHVVRKEAVASVIAQAEVTPNGEPGRILVHITKKRNRARDDLSLSPDMTKTGKRQRKSNSLLSGFSIDKKTSVVIGHDKEEEPQNGENVLTPPALDATAPLHKKDILLSPEEAHDKAKKLPKGYTYVPVFVQPNDGESLPPKRERKKVALGDFVDSEKQVNNQPKPKKQKGPKPKKVNIVAPIVKKQNVPPDEITAQLMKKQELEQQLNALTQQLAMVSQTLETKKKEVKTLEKMEKEVKPEYDVEIAVEDTNDVQEFTLPSGTVIKKVGSSKSQKYGVTKKMKKEKPSVYDRFDSDEDVDIRRSKKGSKRNKSLGNGERPQRSRKNKLINFDDDEDEDIDDLGLSEPLTPRSSKKGDGLDESQVDSLLKPCLKILKELRKNRMAIYFLEPVDPEKLNIPDYFQIIKEPMDFGTIYQKLCTGQYNSIEQFGQDMRLVFSNAQTYNPSQTEVHTYATQLSKMFEKRFVGIGGISLAIPISPEQPSVEPPPVPPAIDTSKTRAELANTIYTLQYSMKELREEISKIKKEKTATSPGISTPRNRAPPRPREELKEMTFDEKRKLSLAINNLQPENLGKIVQIIHQRMPNLAQNSPDEIEIDIDALDTSTLRALEKYVKSCQSKQSGKKKGRPPGNTNAGLPKYIQAEHTVQQTSKSIQDVKKKLKELNNKTTGLSSEKNKKKKKDQDDGEEVEIDDDIPAKSYPTIEIEKDNKSDSSTSDSDSTSSSTDSSSSDSEDEKEPITCEESKIPASTPPPASEEKPEQDQRDNILPSPERDTSNNLPQEDTKSALVEESPQILAPTVKKEVELKNLDSWTNLGALETTTPSTDTQVKDETWSQFQNRDAQNKQREKEREEQQEKEKREKAEREAERRRQEEQRQKEMAEQEQKRLQQEEEAKLAAQREIEAKRAAEKAAREQVSQNSINMMDQLMLMSSFEMGLEQPIDTSELVKMRVGKSEEKTEGSIQ